jgi:hypothetical protein
VSKNLITEMSVKLAIVQMASSVTTKTVKVQTQRIPNFNFPVKNLKVNLSWPVHGVKRKI